MSRNDNDHRIISAKNVPYVSVAGVRLSPPLRVLLIDDSEDDALRVLAALHDGGLNIVTLQVEDSAGLAAALTQRWDVVICALQMRAYSCVEALVLCRAHDAEMRFVLIAEPCADPRAIAAISAGTGDYVMKDDLAPLVPAVLRQWSRTLHADCTQSETMLRKLADHYPLTYLSNRRRMLDRLAQALERSVDSAYHGAVLICNLDHFKAVNNTYGNEAGDQLLRQSAARLWSCARAQDILWRSCGDEFVIVVESLDGVLADATAQAETIARSMLAAIKVPYRLDVGHHNLTASIGIALFCGQALTPDEIICQASLALLSAKSAGGNELGVFDPEMQARSTLRDTLKADVRQGLDLNYFELHYQPQVDSEERMTGVEALLRLQHPVKGLIMPALLIGVAEETGMINELGYWMLNVACRQLALWSLSDKSAHLTMSVNISARQFSDPQFVPQVLQIMDRCGINPARLILELTESVLLEEIDVVIEKMLLMRRAGLRFSLDDFGTGYSSLAYLKHLPVYEIKIDRSFVSEILEDANTAAIVGAIISVANSLGLVIIAEGVEEVEQLNYLENNGCTRFQGYLFGRAMPIAMLDAWQKQRH